MITGRQAIKGVFESAFVRTGLTALARERMRGRTLVLAYHNVVADGHEPRGDRSLHIPVRAFRRHLDVIQRLCDVIGLRAIGAAPTSWLPRVVITFDDAYRGALTHALPELARRSLPCTVFVPAGFVPDGTFWWDDLARSDAGLTAEIRAAALTAGRGCDGEVRALFAGRVPASAASAGERCATIDELRAAVSSGLATLGSHTWSHPNLARATPTELATELERSRQWLESNFASSTVSAISYPYGLESPEVRAAARRAGYDMGFLVSGGWMPVGANDPMALPRLNVPAGLSAAGLTLRLSGLFTS